MGGGNRHRRAKGHGQVLSEINALKARMGQAELEIKNQDVRDSISKETGEWLTHQAFLWSNATRDTENALYIADHRWDEIFKAQAKTTLLDEVWNGLISTLVPIGVEFTMFAGVLKLATLGEERRAARLAAVVSKNSPRKQKKLARAMKNLEMAQESFEKSTEGLKEMGAHASVETGKSITEGSEQNEAGDTQEVRGKAKLAFLETTLEDCKKTRDFVEALRHELADGLSATTPQEALEEQKFVQLTWTDCIGVAPSPYDRDETLQQMGLILLYDMLRVYCKQSVRLVTAFGVARLPTTRHQVIAKLWEITRESNRNTGGQLSVVDSSSTSHQMLKAEAERSSLDFIEFEGFNGAQRTRMYDDFKEIRNFGTDRPVITDWLDLVRSWDFATG